MIRPPSEFLPQGKIQISLSWVVSAVLFLVPLGIGLGGYKAGYENQAGEIREAKTEVLKLRNDLGDLRYEIGKLSQSVDDLRDSLDERRRKP